MHVEVNPEILRWACERAGLNTMIVAERVPQLTAWERGEKHPTLKQLEKFAKRVHAPLGYFFLATPPEEKLPVPDFRTTGNYYSTQPTTVSTWAMGQDYEQAAVNTFLQAADYYLIAHALALNCTVITHEIKSNSKKRIKIPDVCVGMDIKFMSPYTMLRHERVRFVSGQ